MNTPMQDSLSAISRKLHADFSSVLMDPLPDELKSLIAQVWARESAARAGGRGVELASSGTVPLDVQP